MLGFVGLSTDNEADQEVSPLSELAVQVYKAVSASFKSKIEIFLHPYYEAIFSELTVDD